MPRISVLFRNLFRGSRVEADLEEELNSYVQLSVEEKMAEGFSEQEARRSVRLQSGGGDQLKEAVREVRAGFLIHQFLQDTRYAFRTFRRSPGFAAFAILTLALGIGVNTAMFSLFDAVLLRTLPVADPHQLYVLNEINPREQGPASLSWPGFQRLQRSLPAGAESAAIAGPARLNLLAETGGLQPISAQLVSGEYFTMLGVPAAMGRVLNREDNRSAAAVPPAVLSHPAWIKRFGGDPQILGRTLKLNGAPVTIVGVAGQGFYGVSLGDSPEVWLPLTAQHEVRYRGNATSYNGDSDKPWPAQENIYWLRAIARITPPASASSATAALSVAFQHEQELTARQIGLQRDRRLVLDPGSSGFTNLRNRLATPLKVLFAMVTLVLLIACANIAGLVIARGSARHKEFAVRLSLGASRGRLLRQLLTENMLLSLIGGTFGLLFVVWAIPTLPRLFSIPVTLQVDRRLFLYTLGASLLTGLLFGSIPALRGTRGNVTATAPMSRQLLGNGLIVAQVALSFLLVTSAALLGRSMLNLVRVDLGFDREHIVTIVLDTESTGLRPNQLPELYIRLIEKVQSVPGVKAATIAKSSLAGGGTQSSGIHVPGYTPQPSERPGITENFVTPGYFHIMGMRLRQGRDFTAHDAQGAPKVAVINDAFARRYFAGRNPIGRKYGYSAGHSGFQIIGVLADSKTVNPRQPATPMAYRPLSQEMDYARSLEVRAEGSPMAVMPQLRNAIAAVAPNLPIVEATPLAERVDRSIGQDRLLAQVTGAFALLALLLACSGIFGLMSYRVTRRTPEFGIRIALGASRLNVISMVLRESSTLVAAGLALGLLASLAGASFIRSLLFGLTPTDPLTIAAAAAFLSVVAFIAAFLPARRAALVDPNIALRHD